MTSMITCLLATCLSFQYDAPVTRTPQLTATDISSQMPKGAVSATCRVKSYFRHTENGATRGEKFDVALEMVLTGHAFATIGLSDDYEDAEARARLARKGFWSGEFTRPSEWQAQRKAYRK